jgi:hypothetical protein
MVSEPNPLHKLGCLLHFSLSPAGFVTALSDRLWSRGRFPASGVSSILPALTAWLAGEMPSLREGDRYFWAAPLGAATAYCHSSQFKSAQFKFSVHDPELGLAPDESTRAG